MPISMSRYVNVNSVVGAGENVSTRLLSGMIITGNTLAPTGQFLSFNSAQNVGTYFGFSSEEYYRAVFYFGWISKNGYQPSALDFWFWNNDTATGSLIYGVQNPSVALSTFTAITNGDFTLTLGGYTDHITGINCSGDASLTAVAATIQAAIRAITAGGSAWTGATVAYNSTTSSFNLTSGLTGTDVVSVAAGVTTDLAGPLGWLTGAILSNGTAAQTIAANLAALNTLDNNFGSFCFTYGLAPTLSTIEAAANWNNSLTPNIQYLFSVVVTAANAAAWYAALNTIGGLTLTLQYPGGSDPTGAYHEMMPMMIEAATNYNGLNSVQNYMFQQFNATPTVTSDANANTYDALLINYYGQTQTAGQLLAFYQRGNMYGIATQPQKQNIYVNELWFKDACSASLMTLLLTLSQLPANAQGRSQCLAILQGIINQAFTNGTISVGKTLNVDQQLYITNATGDPKAWQQVQNIGYWVDAAVESYVNNDITEYKIVYTLIYSKDDVITLIDGTDILI